MINAVIFDMDGLLIDSEKIYKYAWQEEAANLGYVLSDEIYADFVGVPIERCEDFLLEQFGKDFPLRIFQKGWRKRKEEIVRANGLLVKPGAIEMIQWLSECNIRLGHFFSLDRNRRT